MTRKNTLTGLIIPVALFLVLELLITQLGVYQALNALYYHFNLTQFEANFLFKISELFVVILLNHWITKQSFYMHRSFTIWDYAFWLLIIAMALPFFKTPDLIISLATGVMGGFSEEFLTRGVLLGRFLDYTSRNGYSYRKLMEAVAISNLIFALLHLTNLSHASLQYVLVQIVLSFFGGLAYSALYVQTGSLWYPIALHFATDYMRTANDMSQIQDGRFESMALMVLNYLKIGLIIYVFWPRKHAPALVQRIQTDRKN
ncbi:MULTISPECIES: CPBP family intramembrane glutamic endopeptidase [Fructobacillus]|nr:MULTISPECIES: CPBP family intramembrane glutamic endopeptidase [Fructobacillus]USS92180.1 CPBP family intramembrane metalloprotease [Fructobacillus americanaquae]